MTTNVLQTKGPQISAILARGEDVYGLFKMDRPPREGLDQSSIETHAQYMKRHAIENYATA